MRCKRPDHAKAGPMRVAGIDLGKVRVGLALSDELGMLAHPRPFLDGSNMAALLTTLVQLGRDEQIERFIVGLPRLLDGREGPPARRARRFAEVLGNRSGIAVELVDEWLSTREASARLRAGGLDARESRQRTDSAAAAILLQAWLDRKRDRT
jgi:putative holliday junction resolvase